MYKQNLKTANSKKKCCKTKEYYYIKNEIFECGNTGRLLFFYYCLKK